MSKLYVPVGSEQLTCVDMVIRIFRQGVRYLLILHLPRGLLRFLARTGAVFGLLRGALPEFMNRMNTGMVFDYSSAAGDFGFSPRAFDISGGSND